MTMPDTRPIAPTTAPVPDAPRRARLSSVDSVRHRLGDLLPQGVNRQLYDAAVGRGYANLSDFLEFDHALEPVERLRDTSGRPLGVFDHLLYLKQIRSRSSGGRPASLVESFGTDEEARALFPEWTRLQWEASRRHPSSAGMLGVDGEPLEGTRAPALYLSGDYIAGSIQRPYDDDRVLRMTEVEPAIPLAEMIARTRGNAGRDYRSRRLTTPAPADVRALRVAEATELPVAKLVESSAVIQLFKYGRRLVASYESLRRLPLDDFALYIRLLGIQTEVDQVAAALDVMINGDGNPATAATTYNLTTLDPATTANNLTVAGWLGFLTTWLNPYGMTAVVGQQAAIVKMLMLTMPTVNLLATTLPVASGIQQTFTPMNTRLTQGQRYGITADAPAGKLVGFDGRFAVEQVRENNSQISESERWITSQIETLTFSFNENFASFLPGQVHILNLAA
jgi:hypothetical protein